MAHNRPTKKQQELLSFIDGFIKGNGYGPSYREVQRALDYKSVSTVATHVNSLITKGFLIKRTYSARSLEVVQPDSPQAESASTRLLKRREAELREKGEDERADVLKEALVILSENDEPEAAS